MAPPLVLAVRAVCDASAPKALSPRDDMEGAVPSFHGTFELPLPSVVVVYVEGWDLLAPGASATVSMHLGGDHVPRELGTIDERARALLVEPRWTAEEQEAAAERSRQNLLGWLNVRLTGSYLKAPSQQQELILPEAIAVDEPAGPASEPMDTQEPVAVEPPTPEAQPTPEATPSEQTPEPEPEPEPTLKEEKAPSSSASRRGTKRSTGASKKSNKRRRAIFEPSALSKPSPRWGHTMAAVGDKSVFVIGGQGKDLSKDLVWHLNLETDAWEYIDAPENAPSSRIGHSMAADDMGKLYILGGAKVKRFFSDIHVFDTEAKTWNVVEPLMGTAPIRSYHSCTWSRGDLLVFGGVFPNPDPIPDGCSNDLFIFNIEQRNWYKPATTGERPAPRSGHSATLVDGQLYIFGGWDAPKCFNDVFKFDLMTLEFSKVEMKGVAPSPRSWHAATRIPNTSLIFVHGGYDGEQALDDAYLLDTERNEWRPVALERQLQTAGHTAAATESRIILFGGGNNDGAWFNRTVALPAASIMAF
eukprot:m.61082 g.61082  ORF g.61082 m.61082 type:complete len:530 (+) comp7323_c0_seq1:1-1590(+)